MEESPKPRLLNPAEAGFVVRIVDLGSLDSDRFNTVIEKVTGSNIDQAIQSGVQAIAVDAQNFIERYEIAHPDRRPIEMFNYYLQRHSLEHAIQCAVNGEQDVKLVLQRIDEWAERQQVPASVLAESRALLTRHLETSRVLQQLMVTDIYRRIAERKPVPAIMKRYAVRRERTEQRLQTQVFPYPDESDLTERLRQPLPLTAELYDGLIYPIAQVAFEDFEKHKDSAGREISLAFGDDPTKNNYHPFHAKFLER